MAEENTVTRTVENVDRLFSEIVVNGESHVSERYVAPEPETTPAVTPEPEVSEPSSDTPQAQTTQGQDVYAVELNDVLHNFVDRAVTQGLANEVSARESADQNLANNILLETTARQNADNTLQGNIDALARRVSTNEDDIVLVKADISDIEALIPNQASDQNQLADKEFVNSSISTNTANFLGTYTSLADIEAIQNPTNNDYAFLETTDSAGNTKFDRYKYNAESQEWLYEYTLNNSSFTAEQWATINSGLTQSSVESDISDAIAEEVTNRNSAISTAVGAEATARDTAIANAIDALDFSEVGGNGKFIKSISQTNGQISATAGNMAEIGGVPIGVAIPYLGNVPSGYVNVDGYEGEAIHYINNKDFHSLLILNDDTVFGYSSYSGYFARYKNGQVTSLTTRAIAGSSRMCACIGNRIYCADSSGGIYKSDDNGDTFSLATSISTGTGGIRCICGSRDMLYIYDGYYGRIFKYDGQTLTQVPLNVGSAGGNGTLWYIEITDKVIFHSSWQQYFYVLENGTFVRKGYCNTVYDLCADETGNYYFGYGNGGYITKTSDFINFTNLYVNNNAGGSIGYCALSKNFYLTDYNKSNIYVTKEKDLSNLSLVFTESQSDLSYIYLTKLNIICLDVLIKKDGVTSPVLLLKSAYPDLYSTLGDAYSVSSTQFGVPRKIKTDEYSNAIKAI